jgi:hypothetical protein
MQFKNSSKSKKEKSIRFRLDMEERSWAVLMQQRLGIIVTSETQFLYFEEFKFLNVFLSLIISEV